MIEDTIELVEHVLKKLIYAPTAVATMDVAVNTSRSVQSGGGVSLTEWSVVAALGIAAFFLKRMVTKVDDLSERMTATETHQADCKWNTGGRREYDPTDRAKGP